MIETIRRHSVSVLATALSLFTVYEVSYGLLPPTSQLAVFALLGLSLCLLMYPVAKPLKDVTALRVVDFLLVGVVVFCCGYVVWEGNALAERGGRFTSFDVFVAVTGTVLVLEATRRSIGLALPILAGVFLLYGMFGPQLPDLLLPHRGYDFQRLAAQSFLGSLGVFGIAMRVMFTYVFLFVVFGAFLEMSGATGYIIDFAEKVFGRSAGGPAKVSVMGSGLMGSLSGSAVANAVTTGTFTIPMMRNAGFSPPVAAGITAAAASGGALVPPVMGAGAYMMLELVEPQVSFLQIMKAAIVPAVLYYLSILLIVHFYAKKVGSPAVLAENAAAAEKKSLLKYEGLVFFGALGTLILFLLIGFTPFRAVTYSLEVILVLTILSPKIDVTRANRVTALAALVVITGVVALVRTTTGHLVILNDAEVAELGVGQWLVRLVAVAFQSDQKFTLAQWTTWADAAIPGMVLLLLAGLTQKAWRGMIHQAFTKSANAGVSLVSASACVGIIIGVVSLTGAGTAFPAQIVPLAEQSLFLALVAIMLCSIVLGMGLPSAVCYLLMATLIGPVLNQLGVIPLAAHLFIFYFGMMSMVTPPVALAAYASASIADAKIMPTGMAAFRFSLVGFTLPFMFVYRPELLLLSNLPVVEPAFVRAENVAADQPADVTAKVGRYGQPSANVALTLVPAGGSSESIEIETTDRGTFRSTLSPGAYDVSLVRSNGPARLGRIVYDPTAAPGEGLDDGRLVFVDQRLSLFTVFVQIGIAVIGITALAAGIAGFLFTVIRPETRVGMLAAAALLLSPDVQLGGFNYGLYANLVGFGLFAATSVVNYLRARGSESPTATEATASPEKPPEPPTTESSE